MPAVPLTFDDPRDLAQARALALRDDGLDAWLCERARDAADLARCPTAAIEIVGRSSGTRRGAAGLTAIPISAEHAFAAAWAVADHRPHIVANARQDPGLADQSWVRDAGRVTFFAGLPLHDSAGGRLGGLCVLDREPRELTAAQVRELSRLSKSVVSELCRRRGDAVSGALGAWFARLPRQAG
ncbi:MAG: GAF domain-containing protein [Planctomycetota bacterium]